MHMTAQIALPFPPFAPQAFREETLKYHKTWLDAHPIVPLERFEPVSILSPIFRFQILRKTSIIL
jgi:hypothetical protein